MPKALTKREASLNEKQPFFTIFHDLVNFLYCEHSLQKHKNIFKYLSCM